MDNASSSTNTPSENSALSDKYGRIILEHIPIMGARKTMAENIKRSLVSNSLQGTTMLKADMTQFVSFWERMRDSGNPVSYSAMFTKAVSCVLTKLPIFNSSRDEKVITLFKNTNIGFAIYANSAFYVPVICDVQAKNVLEVSSEIDELANSLDYKALSQKDSAHATFTINYLGGFMIDGFTGIVPAPQTSFLGIGRAVRELALDDQDNMVKRWFTTLSLTADRTVVMGVPIANFMELMQEILYHPDDFLFGK